MIIIIIMISRVLQISYSCWNISRLLYSSPTKVVAFPPSPPICNGAIGGKDYRFLTTVAKVTHTIYDLPHRRTNSVSTTFVFTVNPFSLVLPVSLHICGHPYGMSFIVRVCFIEDEYQCSFVLPRNRNLIISVSPVMLQRHWSTMMINLPQSSFHVFNVWELQFVRCVYPLSHQLASSDKDCVVVIVTSWHTAITGIDIF